MSIDVEATAIDAGVNAKIIPIGPPGLPVIFSFNPATVTMTRQANSTLRPDSGDTNTPDSILKLTTPRTLQFKAILEGPQAHTMAQQLLELMTPGGGLLGTIMALLGANLRKRLPLLLFEWGPLTLPCNMQRCNVVYKRFHVSGVPLRAECDVMLREVRSPLSLLLTNPTSGGLPGREQRVITAGENLQQLATNHYGRPGRWRDIAAANNIDDPFKVRPGDVVYLPSPGELTDESRR
jgi:nucleoid-associated protein YgaU